jgi:hypothetical protein
MSERKLLSVLKEGKASPFQRIILGQNLHKPFSRLYRITGVLFEKESPLNSFENKPMDPGPLEPLNPFNQLMGRRS